MRYSILFPICFYASPSLNKFFDYPEVALEFRIPVLLDLMLSRRANEIHYGKLLSYDK
jgi:hypothetical protein